MINSFLKDRKVNYIMTGFLLLLCPVLCIYLSNFILRQGLVVALKYVLPRWKIASIGYIIMLLAAGVITFVTRKVALSYLLLGGISVIGASAHYFKMNLRGEVLFPTDLVFLTAVDDMVGQFNISLTESMIKATVILLFFVLFSAIFTLPKLNGRYIINIVFAVIFSFVAVFYYKNCIRNTQFYKNFGFVENMNPIDTYYSNTFHTTFFYYINITMSSQPDGYSEKAVKQILDGYTADNAKTSKPDVILLMVESYFDPSQLFNLHFSQEINENYKAISEKAIYGNVLSFKLGGGTADIEFNVLNQINTTFFTESISYMNVYGNDTLPSFVQKLKSGDYRTFAMHAYTSQLYNRINAYENMGFDDSKFVDEYKNLSTYGNYVSDISHVEEIIDKYEEYRNLGDDSIMLYGVSMQNHVHMSQQGIEHDRVYLLDEGYSDKFTDAMGVIGSYMRQTDLALKRLYEYFETVDREVVIIVYGDHQCHSVEDSDFSYIDYAEIPYFADLSEKEKYIAERTTPFIMWSNKKDMGGQYWPLVSQYNLWALASQSYGLPSGRYEQYLYSRMQTMPVDNEYAGIWCDRDGKIYTEKPQQVSDNIFMLNYDRLFGKQYSVEIQESEV